MSFSQHDFDLEPVRQNILQVPQFQAELANLNKNVAYLNDQIAFRKAQIDVINHQYPLKPAAVVVPVIGGKPRVPPPLPSRFKEPGIDNLSQKTGPGLQRNRIRCTERLQMIMA